MEKFKILLLVIVILLGSCAGSWETFQEGTYNGEKYVLQYRETKGFSTNSIDHRFRLGNRKYIEVDALTTDWGPPYSTDIYGTAAYEYIPGADSAYSNRTAALPGEGTFLYFSKSRFNEEEYEAYAAFMRKEWLTIDKEIHSDGYELFPHIIGMVYGSPGDFAKEFKGTYMSSNAFFVVENDGRVRLLSDGGEYGHNMSLKVQMPGKRILMDTAVKDINMSLLKTFRNAQGVDPTKFFEFVPVNANPNTNQDIETK